MNSFSNRVAIVTGGTKGIGRAIVLDLLDRGANVATNYSQDDSAAESLASAAADRGASERLHVQKVDVADANICQGFVADVKSKWNLAPSYLVNNAGILTQGDFFALTTEQWDKTLAVNLKAPFVLTQHLLKELATNPGSSIVNIVSIGGQTGGTKAPDYAASKAGLMCLTQSMAKIGAPMGVRVNAVSPGWIETSIFEQSRLGELQKQATEQVPLGRMGQSEEVAKAVAFLLSEDASYITAQILNVNGGMYF